MNTVSHGALFGMFLTITFCLLTQPGGNLVYWWSDQFLSRLNPLMCALEGIFILYQLGRALGGSESGRRRRDLHLAATSLLLIRANPYSEGASGSGVLNDLTDGFISDSIREAGEHEQEKQAKGSLMARIKRQLGVLKPRVRNIRQPGVQTDGSAPADSQEDTTSSPTLPHSDISGSILRHPTLRIEAGLGQITAGGSATPPHRPTPNNSPSKFREPLDRTSDNQSQNRQSDLQRFISPSLMAHKELSVSAVAFLSVLTVAVKVASNHLPWHFRFWLGCYLTGWFAVQITFLIFHFGGDVKEVDFKMVVSRTRVIWKDLSLESWFWTVVLMVPLPLCVYVGYIFCTEAPPEGGFPSTRITMARFIYRPMVVPALQNLFGRPTGTVLQYLASMPDEDSMPLHLCWVDILDTLGVVLAGVLLGTWFALSMYSQFALYLDTNCSFLPICPRTRTPLLNAIVNFPTTGGILFLAWYPFLSIFAAIRKRRLVAAGSDGVDPVSPGFALAATLGMFFVCLVEYTEDGTVQPDWVSWLG